jgi:hypothetical protein
MPKFAGLATEGVRHLEVNGLEGNLERVENSHKTIRSNKQTHVFGQFRRCVGAQRDEIEHSLGGTRWLAVGQ